MSVLRLTHFTDPHLFGDPAGTLRGVPSLPALEAALAHARARDWPPDAVLVTGDLVQDDPGGYVHFRRVFGALGVPVLCIPGNHDDPGQMRRALGSAPFVLAPFVDLGPWRIILLDSFLQGSAAGCLAPLQLAALQAALAGAGSRHCLVCLHHQPVPMGSRWLDRVGLLNPDDFFACIDAHRCVRAILWGHVHQSYDGLRGGVRLLATPATCAQFLPHAEDFALDPRPGAYRTLELRPDGSMLTDVVWLEPGAAGSAFSACSAA